jgi:tetratricopeptide (TPR) repeat protein
MKPTYSSRDVATIVGISESRVRYWAQTGVVGPSEKVSGRALYSFQDLVSVKAAKELLDGGLTLQRARKNLEALRTQLGENRPLANVRVRSDGERVVVTDDGASFEPLTGQLVMDFALDELQGQLAELATATPPPPAAALPTSRAESAWAWFLEGGECEARGDDDRAIIAYSKALEGDPALAAAHTNLGNLHYRRRERGEARAAYQRALALDPDQPEARYNLGNLLDDLGEREAARVEWHRVAAACPEFADAHYNLAVAAARDGDPDAARLHLKRYLALVPDDGRAGELLARL